MSLSHTGDLVTHNYIVVECVTLVQRRLGRTALSMFLDDLLPLVAVVWIDEDLHAAAVSAVLASSDRSVSFVDWTSFEFMRRSGIRTAFALDRHFKKQGFETVP